MKQLIKYIILGISAAFFLTGCYSTNVPYTPEYVGGVLKRNLSEVNKTVSINVHDDVVVSKHPESFRGGAGTLDVHIKQVGEYVARDFFKQYFSDVKVGEYVQNAYLDVDFEILDYTYSHSEFTDASTVTINAKIEIKKEGKVILSKNYSNTMLSDAVLSILVFSTGIKDIAAETFHKCALDMLETQVKPDLLRALEENR